MCDLKKNRCRHVMALFDGGATHSFIRGDVLERLFPGIETDKYDPPKEAGVVGGGTLKLRESAALQLRYEGCTGSATPFFVLDNARPEAIVGAFTLEDIKGVLNYSLSILEQSADCARTPKPAVELSEPWGGSEGA